MHFLDLKMLFVEYMENIETYTNGGADNEKLSAFSEYATSRN